MNHALYNFFASGDLGVGVFDFWDWGGCGAGGAGYGCSAAVVE